MTSIATGHNSFRLRSFVRRNGRPTQGQGRAYNTLQPVFGLNLAAGLVDYPTVFGRQAPCFLEIGFGSGQSLLALAASHPEHDFIAIETHRPGIGALLLGMELEGLTNIRVYEADAVEVLQQCIPDNSLTGVQLFFPDPWPKRRHQGRRLIQPEFVKILVSKLKVGCTFDLATDWEDYAKHMLQVLAAEPALIEQAFSTRSPRRPILTKFERRAIHEGRQIWELSYEKRIPMKK